MAHRFVISTQTLHRAILLSLGEMGMIQKEFPVYSLHGEKKW